MNKPGVQRVFEVFHIVSLSVWLGAVGMSGVVAAVVFPLMRRVDPTLGAYEGYEGDHALLGAGLIAGRVFLIVDVIQFVCAAVALGSFAVMVVTGYSINTLGRFFKSVLLLGTMGLLSYHLFVLMPEMTDNLRAYWDFAELGDTANADVHKDRFMGMHESASNSLKALTAATLVCLVFAVVTGVGRGAQDTQATTTSAPE